MSRTVVPVWLADYPFRTANDEPFLAPMWRLVEEFNRTHDDLEIRPEGRPVFEMVDQVAATMDDEVPALVGCYAADVQRVLDLRTDDGSATFASIGSALSGRAAVHGEPVRLWELVPAARQFYSVGGIPAAVPWSLTTVVMAVNRGLLQDADVTSAPATWPELDEAARRIHQRTGLPGLTFALHGWFVEQALSTADRTLLDAANGHSGTAHRALLDDPTLGDWAARLADLYRIGAFAHSGRVEDWEGVVECFLSGGAGVLLDSSKSVHTLLAAGIAHGLDVGVAPLPRKSGCAGAGSTISGDALWLRSGLDEAVREGALAFTQFLLRPESVAHWHREHGFTPVTVPAALALTEEGWFDRHPEHEVAWQELIGAAGTPATLGARTARLPEVYDEAAHALRDVLAGAHPGRRLVTAADAATALLRDAQPALSLTG